MKEMFTYKLSNRNHQIFYIILEKAHSTLSKALTIYYIGSSRLGSCSYLYFAFYSCKSVQTYIHICIYVRVDCNHPTKLRYPYCDKLY